MKYIEDFNITPELREKLKNKLPEIKRILFNPKLTIFFIPSVYLRGLLLKGEHEIVSKLGKGMLELLLSGKPFAIQKRIVYELLTGILDADHTFIFSNGEIRVLEGNETILDINNDKTEN